MGPILGVCFWTLRILDTVADVSGFRSALDGRWIRCRGLFVIDALSDVWCRLARLYRIAGDSMAPLASLFSCIRWIDDLVLWSIGQVWAVSSKSDQRISEKYIVRAMVATLGMDDKEPLRCTGSGIQIHPKDGWDYPTA